MLFIFWNARGLLAPDRQRMLKHIIKEHKPWIIAVSETHIDTMDDTLTRYLESGRRRNWVISPAIGLSSGIILSWDPSSITQFQPQICRHSINGSFYDSVTGKDWLISAVHMPCDRTGKAHARAELRDWFCNQISN